MKQGWTQMPSGRWVTTIATKYGWATCHAWQGGQWEVSRGGKQIASGARWSGRIEECMEHAETWVRNLNLRENTWVVDDHLDINDKLAMHKAASDKDAELIQRLVDALNRLVYLERCNAEGLSSGAPTSMDWQQAFDKAQQQIDAAAAAGFKPSDQS